MEERSTIYLDSGELLGMQVSFFGVPDEPLESSPYTPLAFMGYVIVGTLGVLLIIKVRMNWGRQQVSHGDSDARGEP